MHSMVRLRSGISKSMPLSCSQRGAAPDDRGLLHVSPGCITLDELEGCINALQDELDVLRADARRAFTVTAGHA